MRKRMMVLVMVAACCAATGCGLLLISTQSDYISAPGAANVEPTAVFNVGDVKDMTGFKFEPDDKDTFSLKDKMRASLAAELSKRKPANPLPAYTVNVDILTYTPGNAFGRWLAPGAGTTELSVNAIILDQEGKQRATIPVKRTIGAGGADSAGAYKYIFDEVAITIVRVITDVSKRTPLIQRADQNTFNH